MRRDRPVRDPARMRLELGKRVECSDGKYGELADVVVDPIKKRVTHLVVKPDEADDGARLVPVELVAPDDSEKSDISLRCTVSETRDFLPVHEYAYLELGEAPVEDPDWDVGVETVLAMPYYEGSPFGDYGGMYGSPSGILYDRIPKGEVELRRTSAVYAADGDYLGDVDGFVVDPEDHITHFVLERGHFWGRREVTIPIGAVEKVETDSVTLSLSKEEVGALPSVRVRRWI
jgi:sporulation protein YlmC with PRC-barrel domain